MGLQRVGHDFATELTNVYNGMLISNKKEQILINSNTYDLKIILLKEAR